MRTISIFMLIIVAMVAIVSCCGGAKKNAEAQCDGKKYCLPVALQLYSVRDAMANDFKGTLQKVKVMGYDGVEFAGLFGNTPEQVKAMCAEIGLTPISAHVPLADMLADVDKVIADYKALGCKYIVIPYVTEERRPGGELFMQMVEEIRSIGQKAKDAGLLLLYHNHDFEFKKVENGEFGLDFLYSSIPADLLQTELDECWVKYAGQDPVAYLQKYAGRAPVVHLKDYYVEGEQVGDPYALIGLNEDEKKSNSAFEFRPLGYGVQDVAALVKAAGDAGCGWLIVEQDQPSMGKTPMECVALGMEYLAKVKAQVCQEACTMKDACKDKKECCPKKAACEGKKECDKK